MENLNPDNVTRRCQNPACGKEFVMRRPSKPGKYGVNCPHCKAVNFFSLVDDEPSEPKPTVNKERTNPPQQTSPQSTASVKKTVTASDKPTVHTAAMNADNTEVTPTEQPEKRLYTYRYLAITAKSWSKKYTYLLTHGRHTIGAIDKTNVSDLMIKDKTMSPRSVRLDVSEHDGKILTSLHIIESLNPVYLNNQPLQSDRNYDIQPGDRLILGSTIIEFNEAYK